MNYSLVTTPTISNHKYILPINRDVSFRYAIACILYFQFLAFIFPATKRRLTPAQRAEELSKIQKGRLLIKAKKQRMELENEKKRLELEEKRLQLAESTQISNQQQTNAFIALMNKMADKF